MTLVSNCFFFNSIKDFMVSKESITALSAISTIPITTASYIFKKSKDNWCRSLVTCLNEKTKMRFSAWSIWRRIPHIHSSMQRLSHTGTPVLACCASSFRATRFLNSREYTLGSQLLVRPLLSRSCFAVTVPRIDGKE